MTERRTLDHIVAADEAGERLDRVLARAHSELSRARIQSLIEGGRLIAGGVTITDANYRVKPAERLTLRIPPPSSGSRRETPSKIFSRASSTDNGAILLSPALMQRARREVAGASAGLLEEADAIKTHCLIDGLQHVIDREARHTHCGQRFHLNASGSRGFDFRCDAQPSAVVRGSKSIAILSRASG